MNGNMQQYSQPPYNYQPGGSSSFTYSYPPPPAAITDDQRNQSQKYWGTHAVGTPYVPASHPNNQNAALWSGGGGGDPNHQQSYSQHAPYLQYTPTNQMPSNINVDSALQKFNSWSSKAGTTAHNIWHNLKTGSSVSGSAWGKVNLTAKALTEGGFETLYKQTFTTFPNEKLKKTFACHLSTTTGPVAGTLYLSNAHVAFCSDSPLSCATPPAPPASAQESWSYYKVMVPLGKIGTIYPVLKSGNPSEKYIQISTIDGHDFWFMGFVNHEKACHHLFETISNCAASGIPVQRPLP